MNSFIYEKFEKLGPFSKIFVTLLILFWQAIFINIFSKCLVSICFRKLINSKIAHYTVLQPRSE